MNVKKIGTDRMALPDTFVPVKYDSNSGQALFIDIIDKTTEVSGSFRYSRTSMVRTPLEP